MGIGNTPVQDKLIRNGSSRRVHDLNADETLRVVRLPVKYTGLSDIPAVARFCSGCF